MRFITSATLPGSPACPLLLRFAGQPGPTSGYARAAHGLPGLPSRRGWKHVLLAPGRRPIGRPGSGTRARLSGFGRASGRSQPQVTGRPLRSRGEADAGRSRTHARGRTGSGVPSSWTGASFASCMRSGSPGIPGIPTSGRWSMPGLPAAARPTRSSTGPTTWTPARWAATGRRSSCWPPVRARSATARGPSCSRRCRTPGSAEG